MTHTLVPFSQGAEAVWHSQGVGDLGMLSSGWRHCAPANSMSPGLPVCLLQGSPSELVSEWFSLWVAACELPAQQGSEAQTFHQGRDHSTVGLSASKLNPLGRGSCRAAIDWVEG